MTIRDFILKNGIEKIKGLKVIGFDNEQTVRVTKSDIENLSDLRPNENFRLSTNQGQWIYPDDELETTETYRKRNSCLH